MSRISFKNILNLAKFDFKNNKKFILGWSIAIFSIMFLYMILFPSIKDMAQVKMDAMPEELLQLVGMQDFQSLDNFISYFGMIFNIILVAISIFSAIFSANLIYKEEKTKSIEFLNSISLSRSEIYLSKLLTAFLSVLLVVLSASLSAFICGMINGGETFVLMDFISIVKVSSFTAFFFISSSFMAAGISTKISVPTIGSMTVLLLYMLGYLGKLLGEKADWLLNLSPFEVFNPTNAVLLESDTIITLSIYFGVMVVFILIGYFVYNRRDLNI